MFSRACGRLGPGQGTWFGRSEAADVAVGQEIVTAGGLYGTITALDDDEARVRIADDVEVRVAKRAIAGVLSEHEEPEELEEESAANLP